MNKKRLMNYLLYFFYILFGALLVIGGYFSAKRGLKGFGLALFNPIATFVEPIKEDSYLVTPDVLLQASSTPIGPTGIYVETGGRVDLGGAKINFINMQTSIDARTGGIVDAKGAEINVVKTLK